MNRASNREIQPDWRVVKVDWTSYCDTEALAAKGVESIGIYYVVDANLHVHICSFTPNLEAWPVCTFATYTSNEAAEKDEGESELEIMSTEEACSYFGTEILDRYPHKPLADFVYIPEQEEGETDEAYRMRVAEEAREHFCGNPCGF